MNESAFGRPDEGDLVDGLRQEGVVLKSLLAEQQGRIIGHILFSRMGIETGFGLVPAVSLAPVAVLPGYQGRGVGSYLIREGLASLRSKGQRIVIVLGHPQYYSRFGFSVEKASKLSSPFPSESYMALELVEGALSGVVGSVRYPAAFGLPT